MACSCGQNRQLANTPSSPGTESEDLLYKRTTLLVADLERSLEVYRDILGFSVFQVKESGKDSYSYPVFKIPEHATITFATLSSPSQVRTLALTEVKGVTLPKPSAPLMSAAVIQVVDLPAKIERLAALGLETTAPKKAEGHDFSFLEQAFIDYDGHLVVLYEILPGQ